MSGHTRRHIVVKADAAIRQKGYNAFRFSDIAEAMSIRNAAIHYYFPSKSSLGEAVIEDEIRRVEAERIDCQKLTGAFGLQKLIRVFAAHQRAGEVCLNGALAGEFHTLSTAMQEKITKLQTGILAWVTAMLEKGKAEGSLHFEGEAGDRALQFLAILTGSLQLARALGAEAFSRVVNRMLKDLGAGWTVEQINN